MKVHITSFKEMKESSGKHLSYDDDVVVIRKPDGSEAYRGSLDYYDFKDELYDDMHWNESKGLYDLRDGWTLEVL